MNMKGQGALEYLLLIGGAVLVAAVVLSVITGLVGQGGTAAQTRATDALCASYLQAECGTTGDPDGSGPLVPTACTPLLDASSNFIRCVAS